MQGWESLTQGMEESSEVRQKQFGPEVANVMGEGLPPLEYWQKIVRFHLSKIVRGSTLTVVEASLDFAVSAILSIDIKN